MSNNSSRPAAQQLSRRKYWLFLGITLALPLVVFGIVEAGLRIARPDGGLPLFREVPLVRGEQDAANPDVGKRWFAGIDDPPAPPIEPFPREKDEGDFLVFVLGESSAAGFPYPRNAAFSRLVRDALADVLPDRRVHVVNLGIAATNSFAMADIAREVADRRPDAVLIYAGHNEYYGALGTASRVSMPGGTAAVRVYLRLLRLRTVLALRDALVRLRQRGNAAPGELETASLMEILARDRQVPLDSPDYDRGVQQFETNLESLVRVFTRENIPVLVGSVASNLRDQPPFAADTDANAAAVAAFDSARASLAAGDTATAGKLFTRARDLDVIRFRAPTEFNSVIRRVAAASGARYVPVAERFAAESPGGIAGSELFLEHVHPNREGHALIGRAFVEAMHGAGVLGASADTSRLREWEEYLRASAISAFDERVAHHMVRTLTTRWPFVPVARQTDYRTTYIPTDLLDSLAFAVSRGEQWERAKLTLAADYERRELFDSAAAEYAGFARDAPAFDEPLRLMARALDRAGRETDAHAALLRAEEIRPTAQGLAALGAAAVNQKNLPEAIVLFRRSLALDPRQPAVLYQLSLAHGMAQDIPAARAAAVRLARLSPDYPGLADWLRALGLRP